MSTATKLEHQLSQLVEQAARILHEAKETISRGMAALGHHSGHDLRTHLDIAANELAGHHNALHDLSASLPGAQPFADGGLVKFPVDVPAAPPGLIDPATLDEPENPTPAAATSSDPILSDPAPTSTASEEPLPIASPEPSTSIPASSTIANEEPAAGVTDQQACPGVEIEPGAFTGCSGGTDCPNCAGTGIAGGAEFAASLGIDTRKADEAVLVGEQDPSTPSMTEPEGGAIRQTIVFDVAGNRRDVEGLSTVKAGEVFVFKGENETVENAHQAVEDAKQNPATGRWEVVAITAYAVKPASVEESSKATDDDSPTAAVE